MKGIIESIGASMILAMERIGFACRLFLDSIYWLIVGRKYKQKLRLAQVAYTLSLHVALPIRKSVV